MTCMPPSDPDRTGLGSGATGWTRVLCFEDEPRAGLRGFVAIDAGRFGAGPLGAGDRAGPLGEGDRAGPLGADGRGWRVTCVLAFGLASAACRLRVAIKWLVASTVRVAPWALVALAAGGVLVVPALEPPPPQAARPNGSSTDTSPAVVSRARVWCRSTIDVTARRARGRVRRAPPSTPGRGRRACRRGRRPAARGLDPTPSPAETRTSAH